MVNIALLTHLLIFLHWVVLLKYCGSQRQFGITSYCTYHHCIH